MRILTLSAVLLTLMVTSALAGTLFPPEDLIASGTPNSTCPSGRVLSWTGNSVTCQDPTPGVSVACPPGQVLTGINQGVPACAVQATAPAAALTLSCNSGQVLSGITNGVAVCITPSAAAVTVTCAPGQVLIGITNGSPVCTSNTAGTYTAGTFSLDGDTFACFWVNSVTGSCSCPSGYTAYPSMPFSGKVLYQCTKNK